MATRKFNPKRIRGSFTGKIGNRDFAVQFTGYMSGTFITAKFDEKAVTEHVGSDGDVTIVLNPNRKMTVTVTVTQGSTTNEELSTLVPDSDKNFLPIGVLKFEDLSGKTKIKGAEAWLRDFAEIAYSNQVEGRAWEFGVSKGEMVIGSGDDL